MFMILFLTGSSPSILMMVIQACAIMSCLYLTKETH